MTHGIPAFGKPGPRHRGVMRRAIALWCCLLCPLAVAAFLEAGQQDKPSTASRIAPIGDVRLPQATPFALVQDPATGQVGLYKEGEAIFAGDNPLPVGKIVAIEPRSLRLATPGGSIIDIAEGSRLPGSRPLTFVRSAWLDSLRFQVRFGMGTATKNYSVVDIQEQRAILERAAAPGEDAATGASGGRNRAPDGGAVAHMMKRIPFAEVAPDTWEVPEPDAKEVGNYLWPMLVETLRSARPVVTFNDGVGIRLNNSLGMGTLDREGFRIDYVKMANRTGLEVGDRILSVNNQPVNSAGGLVSLYRKLQSDPNLSEVKVVITRNNQPRTLTYRIR